MIVIACLLASFILWKVIPHYWRKRQDELSWARFREEQARLRVEANAEAYAHFEKVLEEERRR